jgi:glycosyltransferase involved in cell wall biosynthesis
MPLGLNPAKRFKLVCIGDATSLATWSNIPYFLLKAGNDHGLITCGLQLHPERLRVQKLLWNSFQVLKAHRPGGFQYSRVFSRCILRHVSLQPNTALISLHPMLPAYPWDPSWKVVFYIDMTTLQTFDHYGIGSTISSAVRRRALEREKIAFERAFSIVTMSQWAADSVISDYGISSSKVHVVPAGANLDNAQLAHFPALDPPPAPSAKHPLRLGFLGKEWTRKGGPFLLNVADDLRSLGIPAVIRAIGPKPADLPKHVALQSLGFINKQTDTCRFVAELSSWHFGTLFSDAEAFGISNRECLRLGVPVLAHDVGGIATTLPDLGCGQLFTPHPSSQEVANWIAARLNPYDGYLRWRGALAPRWREFTWDAAVEQLSSIVS